MTEASQVVVMGLASRSALQWTVFCPVLQTKKSVRCRLGVRICGSLDR